jgi:hypothetical protein
MEAARIVFVSMNVLCVLIALYVRYRDWKTDCTSFLEWPLIFFLVGMLIMSVLSFKIPII